ncbi:Glycosyl transferase, group 1 family [Candidatus Sulfotelmatomonas gaucii]|uniref:Glycosyl transferase, group 1 family n=1 Tax=Candidatus Sulfuritelmatomonas gaucii TaxID=2043161 RepID=A0A2N9MA16_9BACT|nr:Glycosyl transferase, group 1 family [Candidatus Sulfotelmatomonas gaucii]
MNTLHIIDTFAPTAGGPPEAVRQLAKAYREVGAGIEIVCLDNPGEPFLKGIPCPVHALGQSFLGRYSFSPRLWRWLRENAGRFDGMVMHGIWSFPGVALRFAALRAGRPYGIFVHGQLDPWFYRKYPLKHLKKLLYWPVQYPVLRDALAVFFTAESEPNLAKTTFRPNKWKSAVVGLGITDPEESRRDPALQIEAFYRRFPELQGRRFLLFLARIHAKKGCDLLIEALARIAPSVPDVDLVIAGPDQAGLQAKLQRLAKEIGIAGRVHWPGMIDGDLKWGALRACDAFVLPSHSENFGIAVVESLSVGRPVLISNQVNIWREIECDCVGLVEDDTQEGTERLLRRWFALLPAERDAMAARTRASFERHFTLNRTVVAIDRLFSSAAPTGVENDGAGQVSKDATTLPNHELRA